MARNRSVKRQRRAADASLDRNSDRRGSLLTWQKIAARKHLPNGQETDFAVFGVKKSRLHDTNPLPKTHMFIQNPAEPINQPERLRPATQRRAPPPEAHDPPAMNPWSREAEKRRRKKQRLSLEASVFPPPWSAAPRRRRAHPHLPQASRDGRRGDLAVAGGERTRFAAGPLRRGDVTRLTRQRRMRCGVKQS
jgi:hypothetical protein